MILHVDKAPVYIFILLLRNKILKPVRIIIHTATKYESQHMLTVRNVYLAENRLFGQFSMSL